MSILGVRTSTTMSFFSPEYLMALSKQVEYGGAELLGIAHNSQVVGGGRSETQRLRWQDDGAGARVPASSATIAPKLTSCQLRLSGQVPGFAGLQDLLDGAQKALGSLRA